MLNKPDTLPGGEEYTPGTCIFCTEPFDEESSGGYYYGHKVCADAYERELDIKWTLELIAMCPPGTVFSLAGGAACD